jgi:predicted dehydrogenase
MKNTHPTRRRFLRQLGSAAALVPLGAINTLTAQEDYERHMLPAEKRISANDKIRIAVIGAGIMGQANARYAVGVPGAEIAAACDLYDGRLVRMKELYGKELLTTRDYREILERKDIDAVIVATSDHWHARITTDALAKGKHVYCEKPMVHQIKEGLPVIKAWQQSNKIVQVGSHLISSLHTKKTQELYKSGVIGKLNCIEASYDRQSALGAWQYTMPTDHSPQTVDWDRYIAGMPKQPYDAKKFFWWRNYREFGTGVAGDLFVHLLTSIHYIIGSMGPNKIFASGELTRWKDGRNVPDMMVAIMSYPETQNHPEFQLTIRVNFASGSGGGSLIRFFGDEGVLDFGWDSVKVQNSIMPKAPGIGGWDAYGTYPEAMQKELMARYNATYSEADRQSPKKAGTEYAVPQGHSPNHEHWMNFLDGIRTNKPVIEDPIVGFRACAPTLAANDSYFGNKIVNWEPDAMKVMKERKEMKNVKL